MAKLTKVLLSSSSVLMLAALACGSGTPTQIPVENATTAPVAGGTPAIVQAPLTQHEMTPGELPADKLGSVGDQDSSITAAKKRAPGGDRFTFNRFERPFNSVSMDTYFPYLDILESTVYQDDLWLYMVVRMKGQSQQETLPGKYALELDTNLDGGGDWYVEVNAPSKTEWSVDGVRVLFDDNDDVGGTLSMHTDDPATTGNGYEKSVFDSGQGDDPDLAWARISPADPTVVQLAVKRAMIDNDTTFMINAWAGADDMDPARFDLSDSYTHEQAGTSLTELPIYYPIKEVSELDNACRIPVGFQPTGNEPGLCPTKPAENVACASEQYICIPFGNQVICYCIDN
ncbi:MAG: hypothetical protein K8S20_03710 [Chloroflexi bacterium]|nr:hypothetical protein [Chloroflexota bacterium]